MAVAKQREPVARRITKNKELGIEQRGFAIVLQRTIVQCDDAATGGQHDGMGSRRVPLGGGTKSRVQIGLALGQQSEFQ